MSTNPIILDSLPTDETLVHYLDSNVWSIVMFSLEDCTEYWVVIYHYDGSETPIKGFCSPPIPSSAPGKWNVWGKEIFDHLPRNGGSFTYPTDVSEEEKFYIDPPMGSITVDSYFNIQLESKNQQPLIDLCTILHQDLIRKPEYTKLDFDISVKLATVFEPNGTYSFKPVHFSPLGGF